MKSFLAATWFCSVSMICSAADLSITPAELARRMETGEKLTLIDVRANAVFKQGHIPGAINVPAALAPQKQLPPLGAAIVYDAGLGSDAANQAAAAFNQKPGITAQVLEGGFAAWETAQRSATTKGAGLTPEEIPFITYADLTKVQSDDVVLVDLRKEPKQTRQGENGAIAPPEPLTNLRQEFANVRGVTRSPFDVPQSRQGVSNGSGSAPLLVLIDNGDGSAQATARLMKANGITRYAILAGGESVVARKGRPGSGRASSTFVITRPPNANAASTSTNR
jgi:rhodanese-related sulfurtransferase